MQNVFVSDSTQPTKKPPSKRFEAFVVLGVYPEELILLKLVKTRPCFRGVFVGI